MPTVAEDPLIESTISSSVQRKSVYVQHLRTNESFVKIGAVALLISCCFCDAKVVNYGMFSAPPEYKFYFIPVGTCCTLIPHKCAK